MHVFLAPAARHAQGLIRVRRTPDPVMDETPDVVDVGGNWMISANGRVQSLDGVDQFVTAIAGSKRTAALVGATLGFALAAPGTRLTRAALGGLIGYFAGGMIARRAAAVASAASATTTPTAVTTVIATNKGTTP